MTEIQVERRSLRILFVGRSLPFHQPGGMEVVTWDLARELTRNGHSVSILTTQIPSKPSRIEIDGVEIRCVDSRPGRYSAKWWTESRKIFLDEFRDRVDVVMSVSAGAYTIVDALGNGHSPAKVMQVHGTSWSELCSKWSVMSPISWAKSLGDVRSYFKARRYRLFDNLIAIGPRVDHQLSEIPTRWMVGGTPVTTISNGVSETEFAFDAEARREIRASLQIPPDAPVVISAGRLHLQKGIDLGLAGFAKLLSDAPDAKFIIAGDGPDRDRLQSVVSAYSIAGAVIFTGAQTRDRIARLYSGADVFMLNSIRAEGLPVAPLEAMAAGLPCILSPHIADPEFGAYAVAPHDSDGIARTIQAAVSDARHAGRASRLPNRFTLRAAAIRYEEVFGDACVAAARAA